jgi:hypothetical protein
MPIRPPTLTPRTKSRSYPTSHFHYSQIQISLRNTHSARNNRTLLQPVNRLFHLNFKPIRFVHTSPNLNSSLTLHPSQSTPEKSKPPLPQIQTQHQFQLPPPTRSTLLKAAALPALLGFPPPTHAAPPNRTITSSLTTSHAKTQHSPRLLGIAVVRKARRHTNPWIIHSVREYLSFSIVIDLSGSLLFIVLH